MEVGLHQTKAIRDPKTRSPRNVFALTEAVLGTKIEWVEVDNYLELIEQVLGMTFEKLHDPRNEESPLFRTIIFLDFIAERRQALGYQFKLIYRNGSVVQEELLHPRTQEWCVCSPFINGQGSVHDPVQHFTSNCGTVASLSSLAWTNPNAIRSDPIANGQPFQRTITLYDMYDGNQPIQVPLTDFILMSLDYEPLLIPYCVKSSAADCWPAFLEKALSVLQYDTHVSPPITPVRDPYFISQFNNDFYAEEDFSINDPKCATNLPNIHPYWILVSLTGMNYQVCLLDERAEPKIYFVDSIQRTYYPILNSFQDPMCIINLLKDLCRVRENKEVLIPSPFSRPKPIPPEIDGVRIFSGVTRDPVVSTTYSSCENNTNQNTPNPPPLSVTPCANIEISHAYSVLGFTVIQYLSKTNIVPPLPGTSFFSNDKGTIYSIDIIVRNPKGITIRNDEPWIKMYDVVDREFHPIESFSLLRGGIFGIDIGWYPKYFKELIYHQDLPRPKILDMDLFDPRIFGFEDWSRVDPHLIR